MDGTISEENAMWRPDRPDSDGLSDTLPPWAEEDREGRVTPYSEAEMDDLVEGTISGVADSEAWVELVSEHGVNAASGPR